MKQYIIIKNVYGNFYYHKENDYWQGLITNATYYPFAEATKILVELSRKKPYDIFDIKEVD